MRILLAAALMLAPTLVAAQTETQFRRPDGAMTPLMVYGKAMRVDGACAPLAIFSHGAGGSDHGYTYIAKGLADAGWLVILPTHLESGRDAALNEIQAHNNVRRAGLQDLVATPTAYNARLNDVTAALDYAATLCTAKKGFSYKALLGHSMGGETVMMEAGATTKLAVVPGKDRFDAYVSMSPNGPGPVFDEHAWEGIHKPFFLFTELLQGGPEYPANWREFGFTDMPPTTDGCHWLGNIDGSTHQSYGGRGPNSETVNPEIISAVTSFLTGAQVHACTLPPAIPGRYLQQK